MNMFIGLTLCNLFEKWEGYLVGVSLVILNVLMIGTGEGYLVGLSMGIPLVFPLKYPNLGLTGIILSTSLGNPLGPLIDSIWYINWCGPWLGTWKFP